MPLGHLFFFAPIAVPSFSAIEVGKSQDGGEKIRGDKDVFYSDVTRSRRRRRTQKRNRRRNLNSVALHFF